VSAANTLNLQQVSDCIHGCVQVGANWPDIRRCWSEDQWRILAWHPSDSKAIACNAWNQCRVLYFPTLHLLLPGSHRIWIIVLSVYVHLQPYGLCWRFCTECLMVRLLYTADVLQLVRRHQLRPHHVHLPMIRKSTGRAIHLKRTHLRVRCRTFISVCNQPATQGQLSLPSLRSR